MKFRVGEYTFRGEMFEKNSRPPEEGVQDGAGTVISRHALASGSIEVFVRCAGGRWETTEHAPATQKAQRDSVWR